MSALFDPAAYEARGKVVELEPNRRVPFEKDAAPPMAPLPSTDHRITGRGIIRHYVNKGLDNH